MEAFAPLAAWLGSALSQAGNAATRAAAPPAAAPPTAVLAAVAPASSVPVSLGLRVLLEPTTGGVIFRAASNTVATIYPVYASAKALETKNTTADDVQWLTYWTLYGSLILAEHVADQALSRVPYYYHAKFAALLWLQLPQTQGATFLYNKYYKPALIKYGPKIDAVLAKGQAVLAALYATYKVPLDAAVALAAEARRQAGAAIAWLLSDAGAGGAAASSSPEGSGNAAAKAHAA
ncbi:hypothetical protein GPECTOR_100g18 [Gonium pectorale]|uniref:HVA22-like protein n=1 Tax=Gonium pectorale TaxID=33097 RepID=A0A150FZU5_GONPE|nr:hypothetical protein GPECTOR_100g18 [Gonium pectorale]|eukprot:KXZ43146.1 hypothetical protein GPECTOR_100g18 [Gonium pectorale]